MSAFRSDCHANCLLLQQNFSELFDDCNQCNAMQCKTQTIINPAYLVSNGSVLTKKTIRNGAVMLLFTKMKSLAYISIINNDSDHLDSQNLIFFLEKKKISNLEILNNVNRNANLFNGDCNLKTLILIFRLLFVSTMLARVCLFDLF